MSRRFDRAIPLGDSAFVTMNPGAAPTGGPFTMAIVFRIDSTAGDTDLLSARTAINGSVWSFNISGAQIFASIGPGGGDFRATDTVAANTWYVYAATKAAGVSQVRSHLCNMATGVWAHTDRGTLPDGVGPIDHIWLGRAFGSYMNGNVAAVATGAVIPTDPQVEGLRPGLQSWFDLGLAPLWNLNNTPIVDLSVSAAGTQQAVQGTTIQTGIEPPAWDYTITTDTPVPPEPEPGPQEQQEGSWQQWIDAIRTGSQEYHLYKDRERDHPIECPNDGEPLQIGPDGALYCRYDGWRPLGVGSSNN